MERWQQIERIFLAACELAPDERAAFVDGEAGGDAELRAAVNGMLRHTGGGGSRFMDAVEQTAAAASASGLAPIEIDRYTISRELGRGGMGAVYLAERSDQEFQQQVAIKVVKHGMDSVQIVDRFRQERRMLASLNHPNIARLFDGGTTSNGLPYLAMEYVEGRPLIEYCRERELPIRERLLLFEQICGAVQHAHQRLIVHRDIKPANILVTAPGVPKLLDFGIAKLLQPEDSGGTGEALTRPGMRMFTPEYASPEQIRGEPVSVAADVFSLGAVLYELLTGRRAHQFRSNTDAEIFRAVCDAEVEAPSEAVEDGRLRRELSGDLDNIVALALRKDPARRYASVEQLAGDIRRYLEGRPVGARPETVLYRMGKFVARHRIPVAAAAFAVLSLVGGIIGTTVQARRADGQAAKAERRFQQVRKLANTFVFDVYDGMASIPGTAKLRASVVGTALEYLDSLAREAEGETELQMELAAAYKRIGDVQGNPALSGLGELHAGLASYGKAIGILDRLASGRNPDAKVLADLGNLERTMGFVRLSAGDAREAIAHQSRSIAAWERRNPERGRDIEADTRIAQAWGIMGQALLALGESTAAVERHSAAVDLMRGWLPRKRLPTTEGTLSLMLFDLAEARRDVGELRGAVENYREAAEIRDRIIERDPGSASYRRRRFTLNFALAAVHGHPMQLNLGDAAAAERYAAEALREAEQLAREDRGSDRSIRDRMFGNWILGCVLLPADARRARPYLEAALEFATKSSEGGDVLRSEIEANAREALGYALLRTGEGKRGRELLHRAVAAMERMASEWPQIADYRFDLIRASHGLGDALPAEAAAEFYRKAYHAAETFPPGERNMREMLSRAEVHLRWPRWNADAPEAERRRRLEIALGLWEKLAERAPNDGLTARSVGEVRRLLGRLGVR